MQEHIESWENQLNVNLHLPITNIASFTIAIFYSSESTLDINLKSSSLPAILNNNTLVRLTVPLYHRYKMLDGIFTDTLLFIHQFVARE